jgi:hypothetical protein
VKLKTAFVVVPELTTLAEVPAAPVVVVPTVTVAPPPHPMQLETVRDGIVTVPVERLTVSTFPRKDPLSEYLVIAKSEPALEPDSALPSSRATNRNTPDFMKPNDE